MLVKNPGLYLILAWGLVICIITLSLLPGNSLPKYNWMDLLAIDKLGHFAFYGAAAWSFIKYDKLKNQFSGFWFIGISLLLLGIFLECLQYLLHQGRSFDLFDILANGVGVFSGLIYFDFVINFMIKNLTHK